MSAQQKRYRSDWKPRMVPPLTTEAQRAGQRGLWIAIGARLPGWQQRMVGPMTSHKSCASSPLHAAIAQKDVAVNRTRGKQFGWITFVAVRIQETITDRGWVQLRPFRDVNGRGVRGAEQNPGRPQLVLHRNEVRWENIVVIVGP